MANLTRRKISLIGIATSFLLGGGIMAKGFYDLEKTVNGRPLTLKNYHQIIGELNQTIKGLKRKDLEELFEKEVPYIKVLNEQLEEVSESESLQREIQDYDEKMQPVRFMVIGGYSVLVAGLLGTIIYSRRKDKSQKDFA